MSRTLRIGTSMVVAAIAFAAVCVTAWRGALGLPAVALLGIATAAYFFGRAPLPAPRRSSIDLWAKGLFTVAGLMALLRYPIAAAPGEPALPAYIAIGRYVGQVDPGPFVLFALLAMGVKFAGVISSAFAWHLLLTGQGVRFPFWSKIMTAFLIGRFIGTFLPSTIGLDGYTLYEASRYSNRWARCVTAKLLEKVIGITGLFLGMVLTLPFGYQVILDVTEDLDRPEAAPLFAGAVLAVAGGISLAVILTLVWPGLLVHMIGIFGALLPRGLRGQAERFAEAVGAYRGQVGLLLLALLSKFVTHFTTAAVYFFTALAIGVATAEFWPIVFGSTIQILATVLSPTIAGEGAREAFQALLLQKHLGGVPQAFLSGALGFVAAEAATLWGGAFLWTRRPGWRPAFTLVDGEQVDYAWIDDAAEPARGGHHQDTKTPSAGASATGC